MLVSRLPLHGKRISLGASGVCAHLILMCASAMSSFLLMPLLLLLPLAQ